MSNPSHPVYTFRVNLETLNRQGHLIPDMYQSDPAQGKLEGDNQKFTRSTWIPGMLNGENRALKHGDEFTAYGNKAIYLKNTYTLGDDPLLTIV